MTTLSLTLLGSFEAKVEEARPLTNKFRTTKAQGLLIYLVVEAPTVHKREALMELLWPGLPMKSARVNLRQILYQLGKVIPKVALTGNGQTAVSILISDKKTVQINPDYPLTSDVADFSKRLQHSRVHNHNDLLSCTDCQTWLSEAAALVQGDFLADFSLYDSNPYEAWSQARREGLNRQLLDVLDTLTFMHIEQADYQKAENSARRQLKIDGYRESATRQLMQVLTLTGRRSEALAAYETCKHLLHTDLGMAPAAKTTALYEQIRGGELSLRFSQPKGIRGYDLGEKIGEGAFGAVHRAQQKGVGREVAVKIIQPQYANQPQFIRRFEAEAQIVARLEHPYIVPLYDYWREPDGAYLVMRWLRGGNLASVLAKRPYQPETAVTLIEQIASALNSAHRQEIIHRDVKPSNILLDEEGNAYLSDFGIARETNRDVQLTGTNEIVGSPAYISPEQLLNEAVTPATDIYSLGLVLYELLAGAKPFSTTSLVELIQKQMNEPLPSVQSVRPELPTAVDDVIQCATAKKATDRYPDTLALAAAFRDAIQPNGKVHSIQEAIAKIAEKDIVNPYLGLRPFQETDNDRFFGREALVNQLLTRLAASSNLTPSQPFEGNGLGGGRFLAVVGPSGSGKSSVVKAGLIPALREGALPGSENWFVAEMMPGTHPLEELEVALLHVAVDPPASLLEPLQKDERGLTRVLKRILPQDSDQENVSRLLLVIDQFEELFTLVENETDRTHFINNLLTALSEPNSRLCLVLTLRADFYDRPLRYPDLGQLLRVQTEVVLPMTQAELEQAITRPAAGVSVTCEPALITAVTTDVNDQPGALPLLQYALTELFEQRHGRQLTLKSYQALGGISGALARRADEIYAGLDVNGREATRQIFLRLITLGEGVEDTRRRVRLTELGTLRVSKTLRVLEDVLDAYGRYRLLTFDNDPLTREPTVEVAHEALLREWGLLRSWLEESRADVRLQRLLAASVAEWLAADKNEGFLLRGARLDQFEDWVEETTLALTANEQALLAASVAARQQRKAAEEARRQRELETAHQRAEEQAAAAANLRRRAVYLGLALVVSAILAVAAILASRQSNLNAAEAQENAVFAATREAEAIVLADQRATAQAETEIRKQEADDARATAVAEGSRADTERDTAVVAQEEAQAAEEEAIAEREEAQRQAELAIARELAASSLVNLEDDPELSIMLGLQSLNTVYTQEGETALRQGIKTSRMHLNIPLNYEVLHDLAYSADGSMLIGLEDDGSEGFITFWDANTGDVILSLPCGNLCTSYSSFSQDGKLLAVVDGNTNFNIVDLEASLEKGTVQIHQQLVGHNSDDFGHYMAFSPDSTHLVSTGWDKTMKFWDVGDGELVYSVDTPVNWLLVTPDFTPDGTLMATSGLGTGAVVGTRVYEAATGELLLEFSRDQKYPQFSTDGNQILTYADNGLAQVWDVEASLATGIPQEIYSFDYGFSAATGFQITSPYNNHNAVIRYNNIQLWQLGENRATKAMVLSGHPGDIRGADFSPDGRFLATSSQDDGIRIWDISPTGEREYLTIDSHDRRIDSLRLNHDGTQLATSSWDGTARLWDAHSGELLQEFTGQESRLFDVNFSPDESLLITAGDDKMARVWDTATGEELAVLVASEGDFDIGGGRFGVMSASFSPDGRYLVTGAVDGTVRLWDAETYEQLESMVINPGDDIGSMWGVTRVIFSPDGTYLAAITDGAPDPEVKTGKLKVWEVETGNVVLEEWPGGRLWGLDFSPDGQQVAVVGQTVDSNGLAQVWDLTTGENRLSLPFAGLFVTDIFFSPDGRQLVTTSTDAVVTFWDSTTGERLGNYESDESAVISPDGSLLYTGNDDGVVRVYLTDVVELTALAESRLTRSFREEECQQYLHMETCPAE